MSGTKSNGNRVSVTTTGGPTQNYTTGPGNELLSDGTWTYTYDAEGNMIKKSKGPSAETWTYSYDNRNQMTDAVKYVSDGGTALWHAHYAFDVFGNRIEEDTGPQIGPMVTTRQAYLDQNAWADLDGGNALQARRIYGDAVDQLFARITRSLPNSNPSIAAWYLTDHLGSVRGITDASGSLLDAIVYGAFGNVLSESNPGAGDRYGFTGRELDVITGLQYNRAREYSPAAGTCPPFGEHATRHGKVGSQNGCDQRRCRRPGQRRCRDRTDSSPGPRLGLD